MDIINKIQEIIREYKDDNSIIITPETNLNIDLELTSLDYLAMIIDIEDACSVKVPDSKLAEFRTVGDFLNYIESKK